MSRCVWVACLAVSLAATSAPLLSFEEKAEPGPGCLCIRYFCFCLRRANPVASVVVGEVLDEFFFSELRREILHARGNLTMVDAAMRGGLQAKEASALLKANVVDSLSRSISKYEITKRLSLEDVTVFSKIVAVRDLIEEWCQPESRVENNWRSIFNQSETALRDAAVILRGLETSTIVGEFMTMKNSFRN